MLTGSALFFLSFLGFSCGSFVAMSFISENDSSNNNESWRKSRKEGEKDRVDKRDVEEMRKVNGRFFANEAH